MSALQPAELQPFYRGIAQYETKMGGKEKVAQYGKMINGTTNVALAIFFGGLLASSSASLATWSVVPLALYGGCGLLVSVMGLITLNVCKKHGFRDYFTYVLVQEIARNYKSSKTVQTLKNLVKENEKDTTEECPEMKRFREFCNISSPSEFKKIIETLWIQAEIANSQKL